MAHPAPRRPARLAAGDHHAVHSVVAEIRSALGGRDPRPATGPDVVAARLDQLRGQLSALYEEEERAGLFEQIVSLAPDQTPTCAGLRAEHLDLVARIDDLRAARAEARRSPAWSVEVLALLEALRAHESRENELLVGVLDGSVEAQD